MTGAFVGRLIGFLLLIFLFNGAMYAAVDTTAGEKERRTIEVLLSSAAGRTEIVTAKIAIALITAFVTTSVTMFSYSVAFTSMERKGSGAPAISFPTDPGSLALLVLLIIPVAVMSASVCIAVAAPAKSNREAMTYLTPGLIVVMSLGMVSFLPGLEENLWIAAVPFANFAQSLREVLSGELSWTRYGVATLSNLIYAIAAGAFAVHRFRSESILFRT
jgi:sodium transport system permease protein